MERQRQTADAHFKSGVALLRESRHTEAETSFREALRIDPRLATPWVGLSQVQAERGDFASSCESARSALALAPNLAEAHWRLAITLKGRLPDTEVRAIERLLDDKSVNNGALAFLHFGLAAVLDDRGLLHPGRVPSGQRPSALFGSHGPAGRSHDPDADAQFTNQMIAAFNGDLLARGRGWVKADPRPIFVVGLQRSGTTLVEQILASHPQIHGAGELRDVGRIFESLPKIVGPPARDSFDALNRLGPDSAMAAARVFLERLNVLAPHGATRVVDKSPDNIRFLGLIALPLCRTGSRVIVCDRDLRDIAVSCRLTGYAILWSHQWEHIARRFAIYQQLMGHWRRTKPIEWLDVSYESLVVDLEGHALEATD